MIRKISAGTIENPHPYSAASIWLTFQSLIEVNRPKSQAGWKSFAGSGKIAWKTGTSFGFRDGWAVGTNPTYTVGIWVGNADGEGRPGLCFPLSRNGTTVQEILIIEYYLTCTRIVPKVVI